MNEKEERPWGWFEIHLEEANLKIKRIMVKPGKRLSLQSHEHRAENWVVVQGQALVTLGEETIKLEKRQSVFIPEKTKHRMENPGKEELVFIEVQTGTYLGEDDITRFQDDFGRS
ncbi:MAG: phosphomannose isomerase type II C-terminal cupin domain [Candidatus Aminicenantes bacterium]|jgi:mannose-6-phosphate isomerase-like protein (cupin superfamily)|nr:phosphomannose isomerase type II C-terminal cupin domain [Candidatus Aminicenantes bacterium]